MTGEASYSVAALYAFVDLDPAELPGLRDTLERLCADGAVTGTLLLAPEGINGTVAGSPVAIDTVLGALRALAPFRGIEAKLSSSSREPFNRLKVRVKREIVSLGQPDVRPADGVGAYVEPEDWNALIAEPDVVVIDTRNDFEHRVGHFDGAVNPGTGSFSEFPAYAREQLDPQRHKRVAMYCTGGIRCEKSTALLLAAGFEEVYHLHGGILRYLERIPSVDSTWRGECFVFDQRVSLTHGLAEGTHRLCFGCREPLAPEHLELPSYEEGVSCLFCVEGLDDVRRAGLRERMRQVRRARERGERHIGDAAGLPHGSGAGDSGSREGSSR